MDYSVYTIKDIASAVLAVLIEAKLTTHQKFEHALGPGAFQFFGLGVASIRTAITAAQLPPPFSLAAPWLLHQVWDRF